MRAAAGLDFNYSQGEYLVADETYQHNSQEIQALFDQQIEGIAKKISEELDWLRDRGRPEQVVGEGR